MNIIDEINEEERKRIAAQRTVPEFSAGDLLRVSVRVTEGTRTRIQAYEGVCIARTGTGINGSVTVRKISNGEGVERVFPLWSPGVEKIDVVRRGRVRRSRLYYLRALRGKSARIAEATNARARRLNEQAKNAAAASSSK